MSEMRGYALIIMFVVLLLIAAERALRETRRRWWALFCVTQFLMMWTNILSVYVPLVLNLGIMVLFWVRRREGAWLRVQIPRWLPANLVSAMAFFQMMLPNLPWLVRYVTETQSTPQEVTLRWFQDLGGHFLGGMDWVNAAAGSPAYSSWQGLLFDGTLWQQGLHWSALGLLALFLGVGIWKLLGPGSGAVRRLVVLTLLIAPMIAMLQQVVEDTYFYTWYFTFALPLVPLVAGAGAWAVCRRGVERWGEEAAEACRSRVANLAAFLVVGVFIGGAFQGSAIRRYQQYPVEPLRPATLFTRGAESMRDLPYPPPEEVITVGFMMITPVYDPAYRRVESVGELRQLIRRAGEEGKPLYVALGHYGYAKAVFPEILALLNDRRFFEKERVFHGTWPMMDRHVYRLLRDPETEPGTEPNPPG
jgi:hypothetical protein